MSAIRTRRSGSATAIPTAALRDPALTMQAKGLLALMLTHDDDSTYSLTDLRALSSDGEYATRSAFRELREAGYVERVDEGGYVVTGAKRGA